VNAVAKNLIELTGRAWIYKLVGFMCAAGGQASYMSVMNIANSLMLDFRCLVVPRFVYALGDAFGNDRTEDMFVADEGILERLQELTDMTVKLSAAVVPVIETLPESKGRT
jgi:FMN reductase